MVRRASRTAQASMEYLAIFAVAVAMTLPLIIIFVTQTGNIRADIAQSEMQKAASKIVDSAESVYFMGYPAQKTLMIDFPSGVNSVDINNNIIEFNLTTDTHNYLITEESVANLSGSIRAFEGKHVLVFQSVNNTVYITDQ